MTTLNDTFIMTGLGQMSSKWIKMRGRSVPVTTHDHYGPKQWRTQEFFLGGGGGSTNSVEDRG